MHTGLVLMSLSASCQGVAKGIIHIVMYKCKNSSQATYTFLICILALMMTAAWQSKTVGELHNFIIEIHYYGWHNYYDDGSIVTLIKYIAMIDHELVHTNMYVWV